MSFDKLTLIKPERKKLPSWITAQKDNILSSAKDKTYYYSTSYGDAKYDLKEKTYTYKASDYCNELQLIRYDWYDRYGVQYGKNLEGAKLWIGQRDLPSPEDYLEELLVKVPADKYPKIFSQFSQTYKQHIEFKLNHPKQDLYFMMRRTMIWLFHIVCIIIPISIYQIMREILVEPQINLYGQKYYSFESHHIIYVLLVCVVQVILYFVIKDFHRGRLRVRNNKHGLLVMGIPSVFYIIVLAILL